MNSLEGVLSEARNQRAISIGCLSLRGAESAKDTSFLIGINEIFFSSNRKIEKLQTASLSYLDEGAKLLELTQRAVFFTKRKQSRKSAES